MEDGALALAGYPKRYRKWQELVQTVKNTSLVSSRMMSGPACQALGCFYTHEAKRDVVAHLGRTLGALVNIFLLMCVLSCVRLFAAPWTVAL